MTTDHNLIAQACRLAGLEPKRLFFAESCLWFDTTSPEDLWSPDDDALHTLLVWRLMKALAARPYAWSEGGTEPTCIALSTGGHGWCLWRETPDGLEIGLDKENAGELEEPIDIIRVLVNALENDDDD